MSSASSALIVTAESDHGDTLATTAMKLGLRPICCRTIGAAELLADLHHSIVFCDETLPDGDFHRVIRSISHSATRTPVIVVSDQNDWNSYLKAIKAGAFDCVMFRGRTGEIEQIARIALQETQNQARVAA